MAGPMSSAASLLLAFLVSSVFQAGGPVPPSPFTPLEGVPGVSFSNDRYAVSLHWRPDAYVLALPGVPRHESGASVAGTELRIGCRASNGRPGYGVAPARAVLEVERHPGLRDAYPVLHPMFWILGLTGNEVDRYQSAAAADGRVSAGCRCTGGFVRVRPRWPAADADRCVAGPASALADRVVSFPGRRG